MRLLHVTSPDLPLHTRVDRMSIAGEELRDVLAARIGYDSRGGRVAAIGEVAPFDEPGDAGWNTVGELGTDKSIRVGEPGVGHVHGVAARRPFAVERERVVGMKTP